MSLMNDETVTCPAGAPLYGYMGAALALVLSNTGAVVASIQSIQHCKNVLPLVMSIVLGGMGWLMAQIIQGSILAPQGGFHVYSAYSAASHLASGLCGGASILSAALTIAGIVRRAHTKHVKNRVATHHHRVALHDDKDEEEDAFHQATLLANTSEGELLVTLSKREKWSVIVAGIYGVIGLWVALTLSQNMYVCEDF